MDSPPDHHILTHRRRMIVKAILSPPTVPIPLSLHVGPPSHSHNKTLKTCHLCGSHNALLEPEPSECSQMVRSMMSQVGLALWEEDLSFCPFCSSQLQSLVRLKKELDRLGDRLCSMILGLRSLFSPVTMTTTTSLKEEKEDLSPVENEASPVSEDEDNSLKEVKEEEEGSVSQKDSSSNKDKSKSSIIVHACSSCDLIFFSKYALQRHSSTHLPMDKRPFTCPKCSSRFSQKHHLKYHMGTHLPLHQRQLFPCPHCPSRFQRRDTLKRHLVLTHLGGGRDQSSGTGAPSGEETGENGMETKPINSHNLTPDGTDKVFTCTKQFRRSKGRRSPVKCHNSRRYICSVCSRTFITPSKLKEHAVTHTGERPYPCRICRARFAHKRSLIRHSYIHLHKEEWPFPCPHCHRRFSQMAYLESHLKTHHSPPDERTYLQGHAKPPPEELWGTDGVEAGDDEEDSKGGGILLGEVDVGDNLDQADSIVLEICDRLEEADKPKANNFA